MKSQTEYRCVHVIKNAQVESAAICRIIATLVRKLRSRGYRTSVICLGAGGPLADELEDSGANVRIVPWSGARSDVARSWTFWSGLSMERPDIVHVHHGGLAVRLLSRLAGARVVVQHVHSRTLEDKATPIDQVNFRDASAVIATSNAVACCLRASTVEVIYPGMESLPEPAPLHAKNELLLGVAARLVPLKGIDTLIRAAAKVRERGLKIRVQIAGSGPSESSLRELVHELGMDDWIEFAGWLAGLRTLRENWDVAVVPSLEEGFGLSALEAMAVGRAVIASRVGGLPELVIDGVTGMLVKPGSVEAFAKAIAELAEKRELVASMGVAGWERTKVHFSATQMTEATAALYNSLLHRN